MKEISCDVIQDLLPLYVDEMLSSDSVELVENHLKECQTCSEQLETLRRDALQPAGHQTRSDTGIKNSFKKIRQKILIKRLLSVAVAVALLISAGRIGYYFYAEKGTYISLEDSGLTLDGDKLYATKPYLGKLWSFFSADQHSFFLIMVDTMQARHEYPNQNVPTMLYDFADQLDPKDMEPDKLYEDQLSGIEKVYYLPEEYANFSFDFNNHDVWEAQSQEAASKAVLLWEAHAQS